MTVDGAHSFEPDAGTTRTWHRFTISYAGRPIGQACSLEEVRAKIDTELTTTQPRWYLRGTCCDRADFTVTCVTVTVITSTPVSVRL